MMAILGFVDVSFSSLLRLKKCQPKREARRLLVANKQRAMPNGTFSGATRRAGTLFSPHTASPRAPTFGASRLCSTTTLRSLRPEGVRQHSQGSALGVRLVGQKKRLQQ